MRLIVIYMSRCFSWKNTFVTTGILFEGGLDEEYLFHDGQTELKYSPSPSPSTSHNQTSDRDGVKTSTTQLRPERENLDLAILSLSAGDHLVEDLNSHKKYLISTSYVEKSNSDVPETTESNNNNVEPHDPHEIDINIYNDKGDLKFEDNNSRRTSKHTIVQLPNEDLSIMNTEQIKSILTNQSTAEIEVYDDVIVTNEVQSKAKKKTSTSNLMPLATKIRPLIVNRTPKTSLPCMGNPKIEKSTNHRRLRGISSASF